MNKLNSNKLDIFEKDKLEIGLNVLGKNITIQEPNENEKRQNLYIINNNTNLKYKIENKIVINEKDVVRIKNTANGNCYFKCLSQFFTNIESYQIYYRKLICELIEF